MVWKNTSASSVKMISSCMGTERSLFVLFVFSAFAFSRLKTYQTTMCRREPVGGVRHCFLGMNH